MDDDAQDAQDPEATPDQQPVGPGNPRVRVITIALVVGALVALAWVIFGTTVLR
jgi:hypothetical protein